MNARPSFFVRGRRAAGTGEAANGQSRMVLFTGVVGEQDCGLKPPATELERDRLLRIQLAVIAPVLTVNECAVGEQGRALPLRRNSQSLSDGVRG